MKNLQKEKKKLFSHKQSVFEKGLKSNLKKIVTLVSSLEQDSDIIKELSHVSNGMYNEIEEYFDLVEVINRVSHSHKNREYLTIKFLKKNLTVEIDTETFNRFYCPTGF